MARVIPIDKSVIFERQGIVEGVSDFILNNDESERGGIKAYAREVDKHILLYDTNPLGRSLLPKGVEDLTPEGKERANKRLYELVVDISKKHFPSAILEDKTRYAKIAPQF